MKILCANWQAADDAELEREHYPDVEFILARSTREGGASSIRPSATSVDAVINYSPTHQRRRAADAFPKARIAVRSGVGFDNLDLAGWGARGVPACNVPDYGTTEVADHAIALMLALTRGTAPIAAAITRRGRRRLALLRGAADPPPQGRDLRHRRARPHRPRRRAPRRGLRHARRLLRSVPPRPASTSRPATTASIRSPS